MATSLDKLVDNLSKDAFSNVKRYYAEDKLILPTRKGIYPYKYMDSPEKLKETQLPPKEAFFLLGSMTKVSVTRITRMCKKFGKRLR